MDTVEELGKSLRRLTEEILLKKVLLMQNRPDSAMVKVKLS